MFGKINDTKTKLIKKAHIHELTTVGYTIVENVLTSVDIDDIRNTFTEWAINVASLSKSDNVLLEQEAWNNAKVISNSGIIEYPPSGLSEPSLHISTTEGVGQMFSELWGSEDLISSLDRILISFTNSSKLEQVGIENHTFYIDQDAKYNGLHCVQGFATVSDIRSDNNTGFIFLAKSHLIHDQLLEKLEKDGEKTKQQNHIALPSGYHDWIINEKACESRVVNILNSGSVLLWDCRLVYSLINTQTRTNINETSSSMMTNSKEPIFGSYICMVPRQLLVNGSKNQIKKRKDAFLSGRSTTCWPHATQLHKNNGTKKLASQFPKKYTDNSERLKLATDFIYSKFEKPVKICETNMEIYSQNINQCEDVFECEELTTKYTQEKNQLGNALRKYRIVCRQLGFDSIIDYEQSIKRHYSGVKLEDFSL